MKALSDGSSGRAVLLAAALFWAACSDGTGPGGGDPTGNRIAFLASGNVASMREDGSNRVMLTRDEIGPNDWASGPLSWSPDGTRLLTTLNRGAVDEAVVVAADGGGYTSAAYVLGWGLNVGTWSPDGNRITYVKALTSHFGTSAIFTATSEGTDERQLLTGRPELPEIDFRHDLSPVWSPDGQEIAFLSDREVPSAPYFEMHLFVAKVGQSGSVQVSSAPVYGFDWAPDGRRFVTRQGPWFSNLYLVDRASGVSIRLSQQDTVDADALWSPDGTRLAFSSIRDGNVEMYVMNDDGSGVQRLTNHPADDWVGAWSPDGTRLAFQSNRDGNWEIYSINVDGTGLANLTQSPAQETAPAWR